MAAYVAYLAYGAIAGAAGLVALKRLNAQKTDLSAEVTAIKARRLILQRHADLLNPRSLDPEMLEERIRAVLGYARDGDLVIPTSEIDRMIAAHAAQSGSAATSDPR